MSFLALNLQVAEASVAMHEMPIAAAAKEIAIRTCHDFSLLGRRVPAIMPGFGRAPAPTRGTIGSVQNLSHFGLS